MFHNPVFFRRAHRHITYQYNSITTQSATDPTLNMVYEKDLALCGESRSYHLVVDQDKACTLIPNHRYLDGREEHASVPMDGKSYIYAIIFNEESNTLQLRIGQGSHYLVANKAKEVIAAGTIIFADHKVIKITNSSGAYHVDFDALPSDILKSYKESLIHALETVHLPFDKLELFQRENKSLEPGL